MSDVSSLSPESSVLSGQDSALSTASNSPRLSNLYGSLPLSFEPNQGQTDSDVRFLSRGPGYALFLTPTEAVLSLSQARGEGHEATAGDAVLRLRLDGANPEARMVGLDQQPGIVNYFVGSDSAQWLSALPTYAKVSYAQVYEAIDVVFYGHQRQLEYDWAVAPGADPSQIGLEIEGAESVVIDAEGDLQLAVAGGIVELLRPVAYQLIDGARVSVMADYVLSPPSLGNGTGTATDGGASPDASRITLHGIRLNLGAYDPTRELIIDPVLAYSTYFGGSATEEDGDIAVDDTGQVYVVGRTQSANFPHPNAFTSPAPGGGTLRGTQDAFVAKFGVNGLLVYSSFLGGSGIDDAIGVAVDPIGNAIVAGETDSTDFPVAASLGTTILQSTKSSGTDAFVTKLNQNGSSLTFSTYLGGTGEDLGGRLAVNAANQVYVVGTTTSDDFPGTSTSPIQSTRAGGQDAFVTKIQRDGASILYSTYLGGPGLDVDTGGGLALDAAGDAYVTGDTASTTFTGTTGSLIQPNFGGGATDAFVTKINNTGTAIVYSTFLGGSGEDGSTGIAVDLAGNAYIIGSTASAGFPGTATSAIQNQISGTSDAFVTKINAGGSALVYSTYLGGSATERGSGIAVDGFGIAHVAGETTSTNFPGAAGSAIQSMNGGGLDAFVAHVSHGGTTLKFSTYLGGSGTDEGPRIAVDAAGSDYVAGTTTSTNFPTFAANQLNSAGAPDLYLSKIRFDPAGATPGRLVTTGTMTVPRADHTATPLADGNVLIAGGRTGQGSTALASAEEYDPETAVFTAVGSLSTARYRATATLLADERVLIAGGVDANGNSLSSAEIYDPSTTTFSPAGSMASARDRATATLLADGRVLIAGGLLTVGGSNTILTSAEVYNPATNTFSSTGTMNSPHYDHTATLLVNGRVLIVGSGQNSLAPASAELYDPDTGLFTATGSLITGRGAHTATLLGVGGVLIAGGEDAAGNALASAEIYNPATGTFSATGAMSTPRAVHQATPLPLFGLVLLTGGASSSTSALTVDEIYNPGFGRFSGVGYLGTARAHHRAVFMASGQTLIVGGFDATGAGLASAELGTPGNRAAFGVNSTGDEPDTNPGDGFARTAAGATTLRAAIQETNALAGGDVIIFSGLAGAGVKTINLLSPLPTITDQVVLDGTGLTAFAGTPLIELNGTSAGAGANGLTITGSNSTIRGLIINRFGGSGILLSGAGVTGTIIEGNYIGTNAAGTAASANGAAGISLADAPNSIIGGLTNAARNVIAGNADSGIAVSGAGAIGNLIQGNIIGLNAAGTAVIGNGTSGVLVSGSRSNTIGGTSSSARNIISGNLNGIHVSGAAATANLVLGNYIGTNSAGTAALGNSAYGVLLDNTPNNIVGGTTAGAANVISGNTNEGVRLDGAGSSGNLVQGNLIGANAAGTGPLGNADGGVVVTNGASNNTIGGSIAGAGNTIAFNTFNGVIINGATSTGNRVQGNAIFSNTDLGIDLGDDGVTPNDPGDGDGSPNHLQNFPVLTTAAAGTATISGTLDSQANTAYTLEFFANTTGDPSGFGEGQRFLGRSAVTTNGSGQATFTLSFPASITIGEIITATATDPNGNTSEFSAGLAVSNSAVASYPLTVKISNIGGTGKVTSLPLGIDTTSSDTTESYPSGTIVTLTAVPAAGSVFGGWSALGVNSSDSILKVNVAEARTYTATFLEAGAGIVVNQVLPDTTAFYAIAYDPAGDKLYGLQGGPSGYQLVEVNPVSGATSLVASLSLPPGRAGTSGSLTVDSVHHRVYFGTRESSFAPPFTADSSRLVGVDTNGAGIVVNQVLPDTTAFYAIAYDPAGDKLYGLQGGPSGYQLVEVNPVSGATSLVASLSLPPGRAGTSGSLTVDSVHHRAYFDTREFSFAPPFTADSTRLVGVGIVATTAAPVVNFPEASSLWPSTLTFAWEAIIPPSGQALLGYNLYVGRQPGVYDPPIFVPASMTSVTLTDLPAVEHFFTVTALLGPAGGLGPLSAEGVMLEAGGLRLEVGQGSDLQPPTSNLQPSASLFPEAAPIAQPDVYAIPSKGVLFVTVPATGVLANDRDPDRDRLMAELITGPSQGTLVAFRADGSFIYEASRTFSGSDTFTYQATDGSLTSSLATVRIVEAQESGFSVEVIASPSVGLSNFSVVDEGTAGGPSQWAGAFTTASTLMQASPIDTPTDTSPAQRGTFLFLTNGILKGRTDYTLLMTLRSDTTGALGVMFRYLDAKNYYRFSMDTAEGYRRLIKMVDGTPTVLREETGEALGGPAYVPGTSYELAITVVESTLSVQLVNPSGVKLVNWEVIDATLGNSGLAVYSAGNSGSFYGPVVIQDLDRPDPQLVNLQVNVTGTGRGTVSASNAALTFPGSPATTVRTGTPVVLTAQPGPGFTFGGWKRGDGTLLSADPQLPLTVHAPTIVEAVFDGTPLPSVNLDVFGDGTLTADGEGRTILRYLSGAPDSQLITGPASNGPTPSGAAFTRSAADIRAYLDSARTTLLDVDGDGQANPFTDGRLIYRFLSEMKDADLLKGQVRSPTAKRDAPETIRRFLAPYHPEHETIAPALTASLLQDTGISATDRLTMNPTVGGAVEDMHALTTFRAWLDHTSSAQFTDVLDALAPVPVSPGGPVPSTRAYTFTLDRARLEQILGSTLSEGAHTLQLVAGDLFGNQTSLALPFVLDATAPSLTMTAPAENALLTTQSRLTGQVIDANKPTSLSYQFEASASPVVVPLASTDGTFDVGLALQGLTPGATSVTVTVTDRAGHTSTVTRLVTIPETTLSSDAGLNEVAPAVSAQLSASESSSLASESSVISSQLSVSNPEPRTADLVSMSSFNAQSSSFSVSDSAPSTSSEIPLTPHPLPRTVPMGFSSLNLSLNLNLSASPADDEPLMSSSPAWLGDFVVSSAVLTDDPNRDLAVALA